MPGDGRNLTETLEFVIFEYKPLERSREEDRVVGTWYKVRYLRERMGREVSMWELRTACYIDH